MISCKTKSIEKDLCIETSYVQDSLSETKVPLIIDSSEWKALSKGMILSIDSLNLFQILLKRYNFDTICYSLDTNSLRYRFKKRDYLNEYINDSISICFIDEERRMKQYQLNSNKFVAYMNDNGFETKGTLFILLEKIDSTHYQYFTTINKYLLASIGYSFIDTIFYYNNNNFIVGKSIGGDAGDEWGVFWIGVWNNFGNLDLKYQKKWENNMLDTITNEYFCNINSSKGNIVLYQKNKLKQSEFIKLNEIVNFKSNYH